MALLQVSLILLLMAKICAASADNREKLIPGILLGAYVPCVIILMLVYYLVLKDKFGPNHVTSTPSPVRTVSEYVPTHSRPQRQPQRQPQPEAAVVAQRVRVIGTGDSATVEKTTAIADSHGNVITRTEAAHLDSDGNVVVADRITAQDRHGNVVSHGEVGAADARGNIATSEHTRAITRY